jgi:sugar phosphate isomerase/epimerase
MVTRREFTRRTAAGVAAALAGGRLDAAPVSGVRLGVQTYSFRDVARRGTPEAATVVIEAMRACGLDECELWSPQIELAPELPPEAAAAAKARDVLRAWRTSTGRSYYEGLRKRFADAGLTIYAYNLSFDASFTDAEIERGFEAARALGAEIITSSTTLPVARRLVPFAAKHALPVAMHNHSNLTDPNEFATPTSFTTALAMSPRFRVNLDIGHFTAANFDPLAFLQQHHDRITNLHLKDRRKAQGDNVPWGTGDTPIREVLQWLKQRQSPIRAYVEYEYAGSRGVLDEVKACVEYAQRALGA